MRKIKIKSLDATLYPEEKSILFWNGIFSQWHPCLYTVTINNSEYRVNCAEQAMMLYKASVFNDEESFQKILQSTSPKDQKALGKKVKNFDQSVWEENVVNFVSYSNYKKFISNDKFKELIILTDPYILIEASPYDRIWGIGYLEDDVNVFNEKDKWGTNWLGIALGNAREKILTEL